MKCWKCKQQASKVVRVDLPDKNDNWKFRDLCDAEDKSCYKEHMASKGYVKRGNMWVYA